MSDGGLAPSTRDDTTGDLSSDKPDAAAGSPLPRGVRSPVVLLIAVGLLLFLPGIRWGLPGTTSWSQDTIAGVRTLGAVESWPGQWFGQYPPGHYLLMRAVYQPLLTYWKHTGAIRVDPHTGEEIFMSPHAPRIGALILLSRFVSVSMAIAAAVALWMATRLLTDDPGAALAAALALMIGAGFTYFAHLGNVDIAVTCWFAWSVYSWARCLRYGRAADALLTGLFAGLAVGTKDAIAGVYPGMALMLVAGEMWRRGAGFSWRALGAALFQVRWLAAMALAAVIVLLINGVFRNPEPMTARLKHWLAAGPEVLGERHRLYAGQGELLLATIRHAAGAVGWPMLAALAVSVPVAYRLNRRVALVVLVPVVG